MRRRLPVFVERSLQEMQAARVSMADDFLRALAGETPISCKPGCSACCYHPLLITILEAISLYGSLVEHGRWLPSLKARLKKNAEMVAGLDVQVWLLSKIACPLLDKDRCIAYEARPFGCRVTIATGDPFYCDPQRLGDQTTIVPRIGAVHAFHAKETEILKKHGLMHLTLPVSQALLMAERVCGGALMLENVDRTFVMDYLAADKS